MNSPLVRALGVALFHFLWEGLAIALVVALCRATPKARYLVACGALAAMPLAFFATLFLAMPESGVRLPVFGGLNGLAVAVTVARSAPDGVGSMIEGMERAMRWFVPFWLAGMAAFHARTLTGWLAARRLRWSGSAPAAGVWQNRVSELANRLGIAQAVTLLESGLVDVPVVAGFLRPVILLPAGLLTGLPAEQIGYLLLHELAHVRRFDYAVNLLQKGVEGLLFYHPAVWWVSRVVRQEREHCCDDAVLAQGADPKSYASTLAALESSRLQIAMAANGADLGARVRRILGRPESPRFMDAPLLSTALLAFSVTVAGVVFYAPAPVSAQVAAQPAESPYDRWVKEDVAYIITARERQAFQDLRTDEERAKFIEQFWEVRGVAFKEEHYRRIARANTRYTEQAGIPGWKTDRGRIYIVYGPPDEIDSHPSGSAQDRAPREEWLYRHIEGTGDHVKMIFRDADRDGRLRLTGADATLRP